MYGQTRIFFIMARDGLLPNSSRGASEVADAVDQHLVVGLFVAFAAGFFDINFLAMRRREVRLRRSTSSDSP